MCDRGVVGAGVKTLSWPYAVTCNGGGRGRRRPPWRHHLFAAAPLLHGSGRRVLSRWNPSFCVPTMVAHWCVVFLLGGLVSELYISKRDRWFVAIVEFILLWQGWRWERCRWGSNGCSTTGISYFAVCHGGRQRHERRTTKAFAVSRGRQKAPAK